MLSERLVHTDVRQLLMENQPFKYAHLIKFERPSRPDKLSGRISTSAQRYVYLTDASRDVIFDDLSKDLDGVGNGSQTYIANKVLNVTSMSEAVEAKADTASLVLDGNGIGAAVAASVTISAVDGNTWDILWPNSINLVAQGFREGDKVTILNKAFNIKNFRAGNVLRVSKIDDVLDTGARSVTMTLSSEEVKSILLDKTLPEYASFINREVYIYRAYFTEDGKMVGEAPDAEGNAGPLLMFKGIISNVTFDDDDSGIKVTWGLTSHWGDFAQVRGRITSDEFHRALDQNGIPQPDSAIKPIYAYDKGFAHSDTSLNLLATYTVMVDKTTIKAKNGFFGIGAKTKVKTVAVAEGRNTQLDFQLQAKSIPLIYGVRNTQGIPIFADTLKTNSSEVYVAYALAEGEIGGLYDLYIEGKSLICNDKEDFDLRSKQNSEETIDIICRGRADRGDVLGGAASATGPLRDFYYDPDDYVDLRDQWNLNYHLNLLQQYNSYVEVASDLPASTVGKGVIHGESVVLTSPMKMSIDFFSGTESQKAASNLVDIARAGNFKVQSDYWKGDDTPEYWGPNHRLIDTAYMVVKYTIAEGETTLPEIEPIIRGSVLACYNYDYSYAHDEKATGESPSNFNLGDTVTLSTGQVVQIIDKWSFARADGVIETRFRYNIDPDLGYVNGVPTITHFNMVKDGNKYWTMTTYNWVLESGMVGNELSAPVTVVDDGPGVTLTFPPTPGLVTGGGTGGTQVTYSVYDESDGTYSDRLLSGRLTSSTLQSQVR